MRNTLYRENVITNIHIYIFVRAENESKNPTITPKTKSENKATVSPTKKASANSREKEHRRHLKQFKWQPFPWKPNVRGMLFD